MLCLHSEEAHGCYGRPQGRTFFSRGLTTPPVTWTAWLPAPVHYPNTESFPRFFASVPFSFTWQRWATYLSVSLPPVFLLFLIFCLCIFLCLVHQLGVFSVYLQHYKLWSRPWDFNKSSTKYVLSQGLWIVMASIGQRLNKYIICQVVIRDRVMQDVWGSGAINHRYLSVICP